MHLRERVIGTITGIFKKYGGVPIDTPVFELKEILTGKYGEDSKLIYDLEDQGGEKCALRYDLTVPFARYLAANGIANIKRYHVAKVYRRDQPAMTKGRMREFYQCDFDIAGQYDVMIPDAEIVAVLKEVLTALDIGEFLIKMNHRKILDGIFAVCGVPEEKIRTISSAIDKLDKQSWEDVKKEMVVDKGLDEIIADKIGTYVRRKGGPELVDSLLEDSELTSNKRLKEGLEEMKKFFEYSKVYGTQDRVSFDLSLARGLDYYTGIIYEAVLIDDAPVPTAPKNSKDEEAQTRIGSVAAGGRYDELVGMFASSSKGKVPCVGISFGIERIFAILMSKYEQSKLRPNHTQVFVMSMSDGLLLERIEIANLLRQNNISAEFTFKTKPRMTAQYEFCDKNLIPLAVIIGKDEISRGVVKIKAMSKEAAVAAQTKNEGDEVKVSDLVAEISRRLCL
ncbi:Histidine-tRNA ligase, mitochondrial [Zancudomyces culisetae]|uniref:histidine--tRNA ligase n=1 Tax=Zancudomyces culisetae TaxID=1213189 RepID=A0A1R1PWZ5_ZANCU|nr:Histidine-tRNA ligase, mitochondrial [Zancudomyces culisetae]|eukprot:OMH85443.1 Histidine-tRNA ligase, mitochondrial [Zancudomyces culisetae]